ncbi:MAG: radical SAM protein [Nitrospirae bacterium]|nr:radical SAM protein [Nitrospirota bacterium]
MKEGYNENTDLVIDDLRTIERKSLLYLSEVEYGDFCINHVEGCSHGCKYPCYAYLTKKRFNKVSSYEDWCKYKVVSNALELLEKEIKKYKKIIKFVFLSFSTDPFMYGQQQVCDLTLKIIEKLNSNGISCTLLTKGILSPELDNFHRFSNTNEYGVTLVSLNESFRAEYEPNAAKLEDRLAALEYLHSSGYKTWVSMEPYPTPTFIEQDLMEILDAISFVDKIIFGRWNYSGKSSEFPNSKEYYNDLALSVIDFCKRNKIECYIKEGTQT